MLRILALTALLGSSAAPPRLATPDVDAVTRGQATNLVLTGSALSRANRVVFDRPEGLAATIVARAAGRVTVRLDVDRRAALGQRELRVVTPIGTSNAIQLTLTDMRVSAEGRPVDVPGLRCGSIGRATEADTVRFTAKAGQALDITVHTRSIGSPLEARLAIHDARGRACGFGRRTATGDTSLRFVPPADGAYRLALRDVQYRGGAAYRYRLSIQRGAAAAPPRAADGCEPETEPNEVTQEAQPLTLPARVAGRIVRRGDVDTYKFVLPKRTRVRLEARAVALQSPLDPLLVLLDGRGQQVALDDDSGTGRDARIERDLAPGTWFVAVKNLLGHGGPAHRYQLVLGPPSKPEPSFEVRLRPDTPVVARGGRAMLWCEVVRKNGFDGDVEVRFADLPDGVQIDPVRLGKHNAWTSVFTVHAAPGMRERAVRLRPRARAKRASGTVHPEDGSATARTTWLTIAADAPLAVAPIGQTSSEIKARWAAERAALQKKLVTPSKATDAAIGAFRAAVREKPHWVAAVPKKLRSARGSSFDTLADGSIRMTGATPERDTYVFDLAFPGTGFRALRLDVFKDAKNPSGGLGRAPGHGNFVLNRFEVRQDGRAVALVRPKASFEQRGYPAAKVLDDDTGTGWAIAPEYGKSHWLILECAEPLRSANGETKVQIVMDQQYGARHVLGRFRIALAPSRASVNDRVLPAQIDRLLAVQPASYSAKDRKALTGWYSESAPEFAAIRARIRDIDAGRGHQKRIDALLARLQGASSEWDAAQRDWEQATREKLVRWTPLDFKEMRSDRGVRFVHEKDHVIRVRRPVAAVDNYTMVAATTMRRITAFRLEAIPEPELKKGGSGLADSGNFVLTGVELRAWPKGKPSAVQTIELAAAEASFEQANHPIRTTLDRDPKSGWAIYPRVAEVQHGLWRLRRPLDLPAGAVLQFVFKHESVHVRHQLGHFRLALTDARRPTLRAPGLPAAVGHALTTAAARRSVDQQRSLQSWFRGHAKATATLRQEIQRLAAEQSVYPPVVARGGKGRLAVRLRSRGDRTEPVTLRLVGFTAGREADRSPRAFAKSFKSKPVTVPPGQTAAVLEFEALPKCALGTRSVVVRAESRVGGAVRVEYSPPIPFTVRK